MRASWLPWTSMGASGRRWQTTWARGELHVFLLCSCLVVVDSALGEPRGWAEHCAGGSHAAQTGTDAELRGSIPLGALPGALSLTPAAAAVSAGSGAAAQRASTPAVKHVWVEVADCMVMG